MYAIRSYYDTYESRFVSGVVAGMKLAELVADGKVESKNMDENGNIKIGYVGAYPYAEVVSGYTGFYLGVKSIVDVITSYSIHYTKLYDVAAAVSYAIRCGDSLEDMVDIAIEAAVLGSQKGFDTCGPDVAKRIRYAVDIAKNADDEEEFMQTVYDMVGTGLPTVQTVPAALFV